MYLEAGNISKASGLLNRFFDKIYVVSIRSAGERHEFLKESLIGLSFEVVYGQDKTELSNELINEIYDDRLARKNKIQPTSLRKSEIAISMSHKKVYKKIINEKIRSALILEDDVFFIEKNAPLLDQMLKEIPANWDCVYFGYTKNETEHLADRIKKYCYLFLRIFKLYKKTRKEIKNRFPKAYSAHLKRSGRHDGTNAYAITLNAARKLIQHQTPVQYISDHLLAVLAGKEMINSFIIVPKIFSQASRAENVSIKTLNNM